MSSDLSWNLAAELSVSCSPVDIGRDFQQAEKQVEEIVDGTGLSSAQRKRLRADIIKAGLHGFGQIAKAGDCVFIIIQMYIKGTYLRESNQSSSDASSVEVTGKESQPLHTAAFSTTCRDSGWGYFLIERVANRQENSPTASSYIIEIFLYREG